MGEYFQMLGLNIYSLVIYPSKPCTQYAAQNTHICSYIAFRVLKEGQASHTFLYIVFVFIMQHSVCCEITIATSSYVQC